MIAFQKFCVSLIVSALFLKNKFQRFMLCIRIRYPVFAPYLYVIGYKLIFIFSKSLKVSAYLFSSYTY